MQPTMKYLIAFLFCAIICTAQTDSIPSQNLSVISAEKMNVVYRGIDNAIKIAVSGALSFTATAPGMRLDSIKGSGNYIINPGPGNELTVNVVAKMPNGTSKTEKKIFRIKGVSAPDGVLMKNNILYRYGYISRADLCQSEIGLNFRDFLLFENGVDFGVSQFTIIFPKKKHRKRLIVKGEKMSDEAKNIINTLRKGDFVIITDIKTWQNNNLYLFSKSPSTIAIEISE
jgi:hypothetical protein